MPGLSAVTNVSYDLIHPIQLVVAWTMVRFHDLWTAVGLDPTGGAAWALSVVGLVVVVRLALVPLFVKQVTAMRGMQAIQPELRRIQARYKGRTDPAGRQALQQEQMALMRASGANPVAGCLPVLLQAPVLFALFTTLNGIRQHVAVGALSDSLVHQADAATLFAAPLSGVLWGSAHAPTVITAAVMIAVMSASQFLTQKLVSSRNTAPAPPGAGGVLAQQQKLMLYVLPLVIVVPGLHFPIGVLLYWLTSNVWSLAQQLVVIRFLPNPGSPAAEQLARRRARRAARRSGPSPEAAPERQDAVSTSPAPTPTAQRRQPRRTGGRRTRRRPAGAVAPAPR